MHSGALFWCGLLVSFEHFAGSGLNPTALHWAGQMAPMGIVSLHKSMGAASLVLSGFCSGAALSPVKPAQQVCAMTAPQTDTLTELTVLEATFGPYFSFLLNEVLSLLWGVWWENQPALSSLWVCSHDSHAVRENAGRAPICARPL